MNESHQHEEKLFVANRGEIAARILRSAHNLGIDTVLGVSEADLDSVAAREAGQTVVLGPPIARDSYLNQNLVVHAAVSTGCTALHPGYGFLSERPELSELCESNGITFVGPTAESIRAVGDKLSAKKLAENAGVKMTSGSDKVNSLEHALEIANTIGYPVITKASAGGGGRGMVIARTAEELEKGFDQASATAREAFGDDTLYLERYVEHARHIEIQVMGDGQGNVIAYGERDCSIQRRYQKMIEEAPAAILNDKVRKRIRKAAIDLLSSISYRNAGTVEFLYDVERNEFYFMEVNARLQVEHPVSEAITGADLVKMQLELALGRHALPGQKSIRTGGHAIEARILAEDPEKGFIPCPGKITRWVPPAGPGIRVDSAVQDGSIVPPYYDSMIAKLIVHDSDRHKAVEKLIKSLDRFRVEGIATNIPLLLEIVSHQDFYNNDISTRWLETTLLPNYQ